VGVFEMIVLIVAISVGGKVLMSLSRRRDLGGAERARIGDMEAEIDRLRARVATLEKIATDPARQLDEEIARLKAQDTARRVG